MFGRKHFLMDSTTEGDTGGGSTPASLDRALDETIDSLPAASDPGAVPPNSPTPGEQPPTGGDPYSDPPKSWAKEQHEVWGKLDPKAREYISLREKQYLDGLTQYQQDVQFARSMRERFQPYEPLLQAQGITDPTQAVQMLLNAHYHLSHGDAQARLQNFVNLANYYGFSPQQLLSALGGGQEGETRQTSTDPRVEQLERMVHTMANAMTAEQQQRLQVAREAVTKQVDTFAADPKNAYFNELGDDILRLIQAGYGLEEAYEKAVWANPATRAKEQERLQKEAVAADRKAAEERARNAAKARGTVVNDLATGRSPTGGKLGTMDDTLNETLAAIKQRTS